MSKHTPQLFIGDNGRVFCREHGGATFQATGRDLSGQVAHPVNTADLLAAKMIGWMIRCETCARLAEAA